MTVARFLAALAAVVLLPAAAQNLFTYEGADRMDRLVAAAKKEPGKINFASVGVGSYPHLDMERFMRAAGIELTHVPYKGGGPAMTDLMAGHVDLLFASVLEGSGHIKAGKLKGLAVTHAKRSPALPDVPTLTESGIPHQATIWLGVMAPAGTPQAIVGEIANLSLRPGDRLQLLALRHDLGRHGRRLAGGDVRLRLGRRRLRRR